MNILHVTASPRGQASESYRLSQSIVERLLKSDPTATLIHRDVGGLMLPPIDADYAISQQGPVDVSQEGTAAVSAELIRELESSDVVVIGTPMHNFTVPAALKLWIDHVVRVRWTFHVSPNGKVGTLRDRPVLVAVASGGRFSGERARQPDFLAPYLKTVLGITGLRDLTFFAVEGTAFGPDAVVETRIGAEISLREHFSSSSAASPKQAHP
jgi:FMN-dependent NADH-azoreductase